MFNIWPFKKDTKSTNKVPTINGHLVVATGYKATSSDMKCRDYQFELGNSYSIDGPLKLCKNGFHFCKDPINVFKFYKNKDARIFEVQVGGTIVDDGTKSVCEHIKFIRELSPQDIEQIFDRNLSTVTDNDIKTAMIDRHFGLEYFVNDGSGDIRRLATYRLVQLKRPLRGFISTNVENKYDNNIVIEVEKSYTMEMVGNNILGFKYVDKDIDCIDINHPDNVIYEVELSGTIIRNDTYDPTDIFPYHYYNTRHQPSIIGGGTSSTIKVVRKLSVSDIFEQYLTSDKSSYHKKMINMNYKLDYFLNHLNVDLRTMLVTKGYRLDHFINDPDPTVRGYVAEQKYGLSTFINDPNTYVRMILVKQGYRLDLLIHDSDEQVRDAVCKKLIDQLSNATPQQLGQIIPILCSDTTSTK